MYFNMEAPGASDHLLPLDVPADQVRPLRDLLDIGLQQRLVRRLEQNPAWGKMIRKSDNRAATRVIERLGMERIQEILTP